MHLHRMAVMFCVDRNYIILSIGGWYFQIDRAGFYFNR